MKSIPVVHTDWLEASFWKNRLLDETPYLIETIYDKYDQLQERYNRLAEKQTEDKATQYEEEEEEPMGKSLMTPIKF